MATASVLYPANTNFNMQYYLSTHMPLVDAKWKPLGLKSWNVVELHDNPHYKVHAILEFDSEEALQKVNASPEKEEVFADVPNFSDQQPTVIAGKTVGRG